MPAPIRAFTGTVDCGDAAVVFCTVNNRTIGLVAASIAFSRSNVRFSGHSMFDCPEQTQTSPTRMSLTVTVFFPLIVSSYGPPAGNLDTCNFHVPSAFAAIIGDVDDPLSPLIETLTCSPGSAVPQT